MVPMAKSAQLTGLIHAAHFWTVEGMCPRVLCTPILSSLGIRAASLNVHHFWQPPQMVLHVLRMWLHRVDCLRERMAATLQLPVWQGTLMYRARMLLPVTSAPWFLLRWHLLRRCPAVLSVPPLHVGHLSLVLP